MECPVAASCSGELSASKSLDMVRLGVCLNGAHTIGQGHNRGPRLDERWQGRKGGDEIGLGHFRKTYEICNNISLKSRALICTLLKNALKRIARRVASFTKELHQLRMDEEALKEMLEEEAMNKKAQEEKIRQEQAENDAFFLEFGVVMYDSDCESSD
ncbi:hypothetical protein Tco_0097345 [Tanacetum coccineum]